MGAVTGLIGSGKQADATKYAANQTATSAANALAFNKQVYGDTLSNEQPYVAAGKTAVNNLATETAPGGSLVAGFTTPFSFNGVDLLNDPAYQFDLSQGEQAVQRSAAAAGGLVSGGALKDLTNYAQGTASNQFQQSYQNALTNYQTAFNVFNSNQSNSFNRQAQMAGLGQNGVSQTATSGTAASGINAQTSAESANAIANLTTSGAVASSAGLVGAGRAATSAGNSIANYFAQNSGSSYGTPMTPYTPTYPVDPQTGL